MLLANIGCDSSETNLTTCCSTMIISDIGCHSRSYAGVRCMHNIISSHWVTEMKLYTNYICFRFSVYRKQCSADWRTYSA